MSAPPVLAAQPSSLVITAQEEIDSIRLLVKGDLDRANGWVLTAAVMRSVRAPASQLIVDLGAVAFVDGGGLRAITDAARHARKRGRGFQLANPPEHIARLLRLTSLDSTLEIAGAP